MFKFIAIALLTAIATPFAPVILIVGAVRDSHESGNGADAWLSILGILFGLIGMVAFGAVTLLFLAHPTLAAISYGIWCLGVATFFSTSN